MTYRYSPYILPLLIAALVSGWVMIYAWRRRSAVNAAALGLLAFSITEWLLTYSLEIAATTLPAKILWGKFQYLGITLAPLAWLVFAFFQANQGKRPQHRSLLPLAIIPLITTLLVFTTETHGLIWGQIDIYQTENFSALTVSHGLWFWVHTVYSYILLLAGTFIIVRGLGKMQGLYRGQTVALVTAVSAPWVGNALYLSGLSPIPNLDITPFAFAVSVAGLAWGIFGYQLVNLSPIARDLVVESMAEGMIVLDQRGRIADMNPAAARMIGVPVSQAIGKALAEVLSPWPHLVERFRNVLEASDEIAIGEGVARRRYQIHIEPLRDQAQNALGRLITIRDTSEGFVPQPRFAVRETEQPRQSEIELETPAPPQASPPIPILGWLIDFLRTPVKTDLQAPPDINPKWFQARERSFTLILRVAALLGTVALLVAPSFTKLAAGLPFAIIIALIWFLGLARQIHFNTRTIIFLVLVYALASIETYNYGFSAASFSFYMTLVVTATLLLGRNGGLITFGLTIVTISIFGISIGSHGFLPVNAHEGIPVPGTVQRALTSLLAFTASAAAMLAAATILMESLNKAWQLESQALNLLQQERDLLEQRVTERTRDLAEARDLAVQNSNELRKYFLAIEQSGNTIVITDTKGRIEYANPHFESLTGYSLAEVLGKNPRFLKSGEHSQQFYQTMWETIKSGKIWRGEFHNQKKDGSLFWESATIAPVLNHQGEITNYVAIKEDITQIKQTRDALALAHDQALEANRLKTQFLAKISHELRTPLGSVLGYAELTRDELFGPLTAEQKEPLNRIIENTNYLTGMVNELLDEAQIESKTLSLKLGWFSPIGLLEKVQGRLAILAEKKALDFSAEVLPNLPNPLYGDETRLQQILINLVGNAIKFTKSGTVTLRLFPIDQGHWGIRVTDTGAGIPTEAQKYVFEPFRQVDNAITRENRGTGLGLSIVKQLVELMDGEISLQSEVGVGSTFTVKLPILHKSSPGA